MINNQISMFTTSGFLTSLGGLITLPANLVSVWYMQIRMIGTIDVMYGFGPLDNSVRTIVYLFLTGTSMSKICRDAGVQFGNKLTLSFVKNSWIITYKNQPKSRIQIYNQSRNKRHSKLVPLVEGVVGGTFDFAGTRVIANKAIKVFGYGKLD